MNGVTAIANILKMEGVDFVTVMPTSPLIEAIAIAGIRPIVCRQERTGIHMADGFSSPPLFQPNQKLRDGNKMVGNHQRGQSGARTDAAGVHQAEGRPARSRPFGDTGRRGG